MALLILARILIRLFKEFMSTGQTALGGAPVFLKPGTKAYTGLTNSVMCLDQNCSVTYLEPSNSK